jgi:RND superfamily putative drug exporter
MGLTRFKLFSATGPSVALGLALTLVATLTLTPALLLLLARYYPRAFAGLTEPSSGFWDRVGRRVLARPLTIWLATLALMAVPAAVGLSTWYVMDLVAEMPSHLPSVQGMATISEKFGAGRIAPLTVVIRSAQDLRQSEGLALIDDLSRMLSRQKRLLEVRSATQPLGSTQPLEPARLAERLRAIQTGFDQMIEGGTQLRGGLNEGAAKLRTAMMIEGATGVSLTGTPAPAPGGGSKDPLVSGFVEASEALFGKGATPEPRKNAVPRESAGATKAADPRDVMLRDLSHAADGAGQIVDGAQRARHEIGAILNDPVGQRALDRLLINAETVRANPELRESFAAYIAPDGRLARIDLVQADRLCAPAALDQVEELRRQLRVWLRETKDLGDPAPGVLITGPNADSADIRAITDSDQVQAWIVVPIGVFLVLLLALRDPFACANLVGTMVLTYAFALGVTHLVFVTMLGAEGIDWKVPYFLFVLLVAVGVDYNVFLMSRLHEETEALGLRAGILRAVAQTGGLISSAAAITACSFAAFLISPLGSLRQLGFALVVGIVIDAALVRPILVPCGQWLMNRRRVKRSPRSAAFTSPAYAYGPLARVAD